MEECVGCINIRNKSFPFSHKGTTGKEGFFIDSEGCGLTQNEEEYFLEIFYCPVCGQNLEEL